MTHATTQILDRVKSKLGDVSDYRAAKEIGVTTQAVSKWRIGASIMGDEAAIKAAAILGERPEAIMALLAADRTQSEDARKIWTNLARRLQRATAASILGALGIATLLTCQAESVLRGVCILC